MYQRIVGLAQEGVQEDRAGQDDTSGLNASDATLQAIEPDASLQAGPVVFAVVERLFASDRERLRILRSAPGSIGDAGSFVDLAAPRLAEVFSVASAQVVGDADVQQHIGAVIISVQVRQGCQAPIRMKNTTCIEKLRADRLAQEAQRRNAEAIATSLLLYGERSAQVPFGLALDKISVVRLRRDLEPSRGLHEGGGDFDEC